MEWSITDVVKAGALRTLFVLAISGAAAASLVGQGLAVDAYAGQATYDPVASAVGVRNAVVGLRYQGYDGQWVYLSGALPLAAGDPSWTAAGLSLRPRFERGGWSLGVKLTGHGYLYQDPVLQSIGTGGTVEAAPFVGFRTPDLAMELSSGPAQYARTVQGVGYSRAAHRTDLRVSLGRAFRLTTEARHVRASEGAYPYIGLSAHIELGRGRVWGGGGRWFSDVLDESVGWRVGGAVDVVRSVDVWGLLRRDAMDPLYWNVPRQSWDIGVSWRPGEADRVPAVRVAAVARDPHLEIRLPVRGVQGRPRVAGDFNGWEPVTMEREDGYWVARLDASPGIYRYAFVDSEGQWFVPEGIPGRRSDGMGGFVAVVVVP